MKIQNDNSITADYIVAEVMGDTYDDAGVIKEKYYRWLFRIWTQLNLWLIRSPRTVLLPIASGTKTMMLPPDYQDFIFIGFDDDCGNRLPIAINRNLAPAMGLEGVEVCETCGQPDLSSLKVETLNETVIIDGQPYPKTTSRLIQSDGSYIQEVTEPVAEFFEISAGSLSGVTQQTRRSVVCALDKSCQDCVPATPDNLQMLANCGCTDAICSCCPKDGLPYEVKPSNVHYNLFEQEGFIQFNRNCCLSHAILKYVTTGKCIEGVYYFPLATMETLIAGTYYKSIEKKKNIAQVEKDRARRAYSGERKELLRNYTRLSYQEWLDIIDTIPRIPSL